MKVKLIKMDGQEFSLKKYLNAICKGQDELYWKNNPEEFKKWLIESINQRISRIEIVPEYQYFK